MTRQRARAKAPEYLTDAIEIYLESQTKSPRTIKTTRSALNRLVQLLSVAVPDRETPDLPLADLTADDLIDYKAMLARDGLAYETCKTYVSMVRFFLKWLILRQWVEFTTDDLDRAAEIVKASNGRRPAPLPKLPDEDAVDAIIAQAELNTRYDGTDRQIWAALRDAAIVHVLRSTGVRVQELADMRFRDIHLADNYIVVPAGKGDKERLVFLDDRARFRLEEWMHEHPDGEDDCPVFIRLDHRLTDYSTAMTTESVRRMLRRLAKEAGVKAIKPHQMRHRFGTAVYVAAGLGAAADLLGHGDTNVTRVYAKLARTQMQGIHSQADL